MRNGRIHNSLAIATAVVSGCAVMTIEIAGLRSINCYEGGAIDVWSTVITVVLGALAVGNILGGYAAKTITDSGAAVARLVYLAGGWLSASVPAQAPLFRCCEVLSPPAAAAVVSFVLWAPVLTALSAAGPLIVKLYATRNVSPGWPAGMVYFSSTLGGMFGALATGTVLLERCPVPKIFLILSGLLLVVGIGWNFLLQKAWAALIAATVAWGLSMALTGKVHAGVHISESAYGEIRVFDYQGFRWLLVNGFAISVSPAADLLKTADIGPPLEALALSLKGTPGRRALVLGLGNGRSTSALENKYGIATDTVEIDPKIYLAAKNYFGFSSRGAVRIGDARGLPGELGLGHAYGIIEMDLCTGDTLPFYLFTREYFTQLRGLLGEKGVFVAHVLVPEGPWDPATLSILQTLKAAFPIVRIFTYPFFLPAAGFREGFVLCSGRPIDFHGQSGRSADQEKINALLAHETTPPNAPQPAARIMREDYAPVDILSGNIMARCRRLVAQTLPRDLLFP